MIDGELLSHLIFADGAALIMTTTTELQTLLQDIYDKSKPVGLNMHQGKTMVVCNKYIYKTNVTINGKNIEKDDTYYYLRNSGERSVRDRLLSKIWKLSKENILQVMTYASESLTLDDTQLDKMAITQCKMEKSHDGDHPTF